MEEEKSFFFLDDWTVSTHCWYSRKNRGATYYDRVHFVKGWLQILV